MNRKQRRAQAKRQSATKSRLRALGRHQAGNADIAVDLIGKAVTVVPGDATAHYNQGVALGQLGKLDEAVQAYRRAVALRPDYPRALSNLGNALRQLGRLDEAVAACRDALDLAPDMPEAHCNLGVARLAQGRVDEAADCFGRALSLRPEYPAALLNLGGVRFVQRRLKDAIAGYRGVLAIQPDDASATAQLFKSLQHACRWDEIDDVAKALDRFTDRALAAGVPTGEDPFINITRCPDPARNLAVAASWASDLSRRAPRPGVRLDPTDRENADRPLKIAYLSGDFHDHATVHLMGGVFGLHDRGAFEVWAYSYGPERDDPYQSKVRADCDRFIDISKLGHEAAARRICADGIDILIDLKGYTTDARLEICAHRPAPVQVSYLGFPGTTGAAFFDYLITDKIVSPEAHLDHYSECVVYMPHCYLATDRDQAVADDDAHRSEFGIPDQAFVLCSFNQTYKIDPTMFDIWMALLRDLPKSVLWLMKSNEHAVDNLRARAESVGVVSSRLVFAENLPKDRHLARLRLADLALDTRICNGHTTTSDALWAGVPVVTLLGGHFASRVSASILGAIGLPELVTNDLEDYRRTALHLARDRDRLREIREKLRQRRLQSPLFDTERFVRNLEKAYLKMWRRCQAGEAPARIDIGDD